MPGWNGIGDCIGEWKSNTKFVILTLAVAVALELVALVCTIVFAAAIDEEHNSIISLILLIVAILYQLAIAFVATGAIRAKWIPDTLWIKCTVVVFLILLGSVFHLSSLVLMIVTTTEQSKRGHVAFGGFIASLDFFIAALQLTFCISLSFAIFRQYADDAEDN